MLTQATGNIHRNFLLFYTLNNCLLKKITVRCSDNENIIVGKGYKMDGGPVIIDIVLKCCKCQIQMSTQMTWSKPVASGAPG